jgi:hypothetical protein
VPAAGRLPIVASAVRKVSIFSVAMRSRTDVSRRGCHAPIAQRHLAMAYSRLARPTVAHQEAHESARQELIVIAGVV